MLNAGHIEAKIESILAKFATKKIQRNRLFFTDCFLVKFPPEISSEIGRFFYEFAPENPAKFWFFFREISEALNIGGFLEI